MLSYTTLQNLISIARTILDITITAVILYYTIKIVRNNTRTIQIFKGVLLVIVLNFVSSFLSLKAFSIIMDIIVQWGFLAVIIIFQPEIRALLERIGKSSLFSRIGNLSGNEREKLVDELVEASMSMASQRIGALITIEQSQSLSDYIKTGTPMNSIVTADLLTSLFITTTPIHDGAVIIQGDKIACASAYFLPTERNLPRRFGARHRAAVGISEITDSISIVVSEETGNISIAQNGELTKMTDVSLKQFLLKIICQESIEQVGTITTEINEYKKEDEELYRSIIRENIENQEEKEKNKQISNSLEKKDVPITQNDDSQGIMIEKKEDDNSGTEKIVIEENNDKVGDSNE